MADKQPVEEALKREALYRLKSLTNCSLKDADNGCTHALVKYVGENENGNAIVLVEKDGKAVTYTVSLEVRNISSPAVPGGSFPKHPIVRDGVGENRLGPFVEDGWGEKPQSRLSGPPIYGKGKSPYDAGAKR